MNAKWKKVDSEIPTIDDIDTISLHLSEGIQNNLNQDWTQESNIPVIETTDYSTINSNARERRRMKIGEGESMRQHRDMWKTDHGDTEECIYTGLYINNNSLVPNENRTINHQMNCFTIINKHYNMKSDSSSDHEYFDDVEVIPRNDFEWYDRTCCEADLEHTNDPAKRTVWIYSFKNKPSLLKDTEYELVDIPSVSASESSMELGEEAVAYEKAPNYTATARVATPIPSSYVPRLDLTKGSTLPTVTEITEANTDDDKSPKVFIAKKLKNSWFANDPSSPSRMTVHSDHKEEEPSEFKWVPSSARDRRRKMLYGDDLNPLQEKIVTTVDTSTDHRRGTLENKRSVSSQTTPVEIISANDDDNKSDTTKTIEEASNLEEVTNSETHVVTTLKTYGASTTKEEQNDTQMSGKEIHHDDTQAETSAQIHPFTGNDNITPVPRERYKKLHIKVSPNAKPIFTDPIENPESDDWICETNKFASVYDNNHLQLDNAGSRLLVRNELLLKPSRWDDYSPFADSLPSLQITIGDSHSGHDDTWWRRVLYCILCR